MSDMDYAKMLADEAVEQAAQVGPAAMSMAKAVTSLTYALAEFNEIAKKVLERMEPLSGLIPDDLPVDTYVCQTCGYGQDDTDAIDWDVIYGHERCKNPECPLHTQETK